MALNIFVVFTMIMLWQYYRSGFERQSCIDVIFAGMWVLFAIEYHVTNDYFGYSTGFEDQSVHYIWEPLYRTLVELAHPIGFQAFNACVAAFEIFTLCFMFKRFCPRQYMWVGIMIFVLDMGNMMTYMCLKRQFFAQMVAMWTLYFIIGSQNSKRYLWAVITLICAVNIHSASYIAVLYFILPLIKVRIGKKGIALIMLLFVGSMSFQLAGYADLLSSGLELMMGKDSDRYGGYIDDMEDLQGEVTAGKVQVAFQLFYLIVLLIYNKRVTLEQYRLFICSIIGVLFAAMFVGDLYRLSFYFSIANFFTIPMLLTQLDLTEQLRHKAVYMVLFGVSMAIAGKSYYNTMSGTKVTYMTAHIKDFTTIFDESPDKTLYMFDGTREID